MTTTPHAGVYVLTRREREIIKLISEGNSSKKIAKMLSISHRTVEAHRANVYRKLGMNNVPKLVQYAIKVGIAKID